MKKISLIIIFSIILSIFALPISVLGDENKEDSEKGNKIEISFAVGESVLSINGKNVEVVKPYVVDGVTLVPVRVITEAFGADVNWVDASQTATVTYKDVTIKLTIGKKTAIVNGNETELLSAPELTDGSTMLPLRFLTESFGADVTYDEATEKIVVTKEITQSNSIKDYALILKRSVKEKVGDSYYNWSIKRTPEFKLNKRSFDGCFNAFSSGLRDAEIILSMIPPSKDKTIDDYLENYKEFSKNYTTIDLKKTQTKSGIPYAHLQCKSKEFYGDYRTFITKDRIYLLSVSINAEEGTKGFGEMCDIADSFDLTFHKDVAEDLSDVGLDNMHTFSSDDYKLDIAIPGNFLEFSDDNIANEFLFHRYEGTETAYNGRINIGVYSSYDGYKYEDLAKYDMERNKRYFNPDLSSFTEISTLSVDNKSAVMYEDTVKHDDITLHTYDVFIDAGKYVYNITVSLPDNEESKILKNKIYDSVKIDKIDEEKIGRIIRTNVNEEIKYKKSENNSYGFNIEAPIGWEVENSSESYYSYDKDSDRFFTIIAIKNSSSRLSAMDIANSIIEGFDTKKNIVSYDERPYTVSYGRDMKKVLFKQKDDDVIYAYRVYIFIQKNIIYQIITKCPDTINGEETKTIFEYMLNSLTFN